MQGARAFNSDEYKYGFNGQEKDDEVFQGAMTAEYWEYDSRLGRRWNRDPVTTTSVSDYACFYNNPIQNTDPNGDSPTAGDGDDEKPCVSCPKKGAPSADKNETSRQDNLKINTYPELQLNNNSSKNDYYKYYNNTSSVSYINQDNRSEGHKAYSAHVTDYGGGDGKGGLVDKYAEAKHALFGGISYVNNLPGTLQVPLLLGGTVLKSVLGAEVLYRAMSAAEYANLLESGGLSSMAGKELFVSTKAAYSRTYLSKATGYDVLVKFNMKSGTINELALNGIKHSNAVNKFGFGQLPLMKYGQWMDFGLNLFKAERGTLNIGLGYNPSIFNSGIKSFKKL